MTDNKCAFELAQELDGQFQIANQTLLGGSLANTISHGRYNQIDDENICRHYLDLIPKIKLLCDIFKKEMEIGRAKPTEEL